MAADSSDKNKDYGLPKIDPQPVNRDQPGVAKEPIEKAPETEKKDNKTLIIVLSVLGLLILASILYIMFWGNGSSESTTPNPGTTVEDRAGIDQEHEDNVVDSGTESNLGSTEGQENNESTQIISDEPGSITTISQRTNRYYIFLGSYKFRAYAQRHAEKLAKDGFAVKLIAPDNWVGMRVAVGNYEKKDEANVDAQQIKSRYGNEVVISKY